MRNKYTPQQLTLFAAAAFFAVMVLLIVLTWDNGSAFMLPPFMVSSALFGRAIYRYRQSRQSV